MDISLNDRGLADATITENQDLEQVFSDLCWVCVVLIVHCLGIYILFVRGVLAGQKVWWVLMLN